MKTLCSPGFEKLLSKFELEEIEESSETIFGLWSDFTLGYFNSGWKEFAKENGAPPVLTTPEYLGRSVIEVCGQELAPFYKNLFESGLAMSEEELHPVQHRYECSSADLFRKFLMTVYPLGEGDGLLVTNSLVIEVEHEKRGADPHPPMSAEYRDEQDLIRQCSHCRKVKHVSSRSRWDWIPAWVEEPPSEVSHTLCPVCLEHFYPDDEED
jgi:hypothetical protein